MFVNIYNVKRKIKSTTDINDLIKKFGENIPQYTVCDGGEFCEYLLCIDDNFEEENVQKIFFEHDYMCVDVYKMKINSDLFNNNYRITYSSCSGKISIHPYELVKCIKISEPVKHPFDSIKCVEVSRKKFEKCKIS